MGNLVQRKRAILIQWLRGMSDSQIEDVFKLVTDYQKSLIPYDDEPLTEEEKKAIEQAQKEFENGETVSYEDVFKSSD
jgi:hypothetical protein